VDALRDLKSVSGPVLLHAVTQKGHGFRPASKDPTRFHSSNRFQVADGAVCDEEAPTGRSYSSVFGETLCELAEQQPAVVAITAAMPDGTGLADFAERFPDRFFNVGICEQHAVGLANGLAAGGLKPIVAVYSTFLQRAFDQLFHDVALQGSPVVFCVDRAGLVGADGPTHHGLNDIAFFRVNPGFSVMAPADGAELRAMLRLALETEAPAALRYPRESVPEALPCGEGQDFQVGRAALCREGDDGVIIAYGAMVARALEAARMLEDDGRRVGVINARFAQPLDRETILRAVETRPAVLVAEDHNVTGGFGSAVLEALAEEGAAAPHVRLAGVPQRFVPHASRQDQMAQCGLDAAGLADRLRALLKGREGA